MDSDRCAEHLGICAWLVRQEGGSSADVAMERYVQSEVLFRQALATGDVASMRCSLCYAETTADSPRRARERRLYLQHFAAHHFAGLDCGPHVCLEVPAPEFPAEAIAKKIEAEFDWDSFRDASTVFTV